jgi:hypothetical protein
METSLGPFLSRLPGGEYTGESIRVTNDSVKFQTTSKFLQGKTLSGRRNIWTKNLGRKSRDTLPLKEHVMCVPPPRHTTDELNLGLYSDISRRVVLNLTQITSHTTYRGYKVGAGPKTAIQPPFRHLIFPDEPINCSFLVQALIVIRSTNCFLLVSFSKLIVDSWKKIRLFYAKLEQLICEFENKPDCKGSPWNQIICTLQVRYVISTAHRIIHKISWEPTMWALLKSVYDSKQ